MTVKLVPARTATVVGATALFSLSVIVAGYTVWSFGNVQAAVEEAIAAGQLTLPGSEFDIASFAMSSSGLYAILAVVLSALGWLVWRSRLSAEAEPPMRRVGAFPRAASEEDEIDDLLAGMVDDDSGR